MNKTLTYFIRHTLMIGLLGAAGSLSAAPETYAIDPTHTFARFSYNHLGLSTQTSKFTKTTGTVIFDRTAKSGSVDIVIDMKSVDTGYAVFNEHIQAEDFLDTAKFPTATFKSTKVVFQGDRPVSVGGDLTIKGITRPVVLNVTSFAAKPHPIRKVDAIGADASVVVKRSAFNAGKHVPAVGDDVTISIALEALKK